MTAEARFHALLESLREVRARYLEGKDLNLGPVIDAALAAFDWERFREQLATDLEQFTLEVIDGAGHEAVRTVGRMRGKKGVDAFNRNDPNLRQEVTTYVGDRIVSLDDATRRDLSAALRRELEAGGTTLSLADRVQSTITAKYEGYADWRVDRIARTEAGTAYNRGTIAGYRQAKVKRVLVYDGEDDPECAAANGQVWDLDYALAHPLAHPNCVRAFSPVLEGEEIGDDGITEVEVTPPPPPPPPPPPIDRQVTVGHISKEHEAGLQNLTATLKQTADDFGYPADWITVESYERKFVVGGQTFYEGGHYRPWDGHIKINASVGRHFAREQRSLVSHEITHDAFNQGWRKGTSAEAKAWRAKVEELQDKLQKDDGVTDYSTSYWKGYKKGTNDMESAINETFAELSSLKVSQTWRYSRASATWRELHEELLDLYKKRKMFE